MRATLTRRFSPWSSMPRLSSLHSVGGSLDSSIPPLIRSLSLLDATGILHGPSHMEVMSCVRQDESGGRVFRPCLVEVGARCHGVRWWADLYIWLDWSCSRVSCTAMLHSAFPHFSISMWVRVKGRGFQWPQSASGIPSWMSLSTATSARTGSIPLAVALCLALKIYLLGIHKHFAAGCFEKTALCGDNILM